MPSNDNLFTPNITVDGVTLRAHMRLSDEDIVKIKRGTRWQATVTDLDSGKRVIVRDASCGSAHCRCAASVVKVLS